MLNPISSEGNVYASRMDITPGDAWVREGDPLIIVLETEQLDSEQAELVRRSGGTETREAMTLVEQDSEAGKSRFMIKFPAVTDAFDYQVNSGMGSSENFRIDVHLWPKLESLQTTFDYPDYTKLESETETFAGETITAPIGTTVTFEAKFTQPLKIAELQLPGGDFMEAKLEDGVAVWDFVMARHHSGEWSYSVQSGADMEVESDPQQMRAVADMGPTVNLTEPQAERIVSKAKAEIPFKFEVADDFGIAKCSLEVMSDDGKRTSTQAFPDYSDPQRQTSGVGDPVLELSTIVSAKTRRLIAFIRVADNRPDEFGGAQFADSRPIVIDIDHTDGPLRDPMDDDQEEGLIELAIAALKEARAQAIKMRTGLRQGDRWVANQKLLDSLEAQIEVSDQALETLEAELANQNHPAFSQMIRDIRDMDIVPAAQAAEKIPAYPRERVARAGEIVKELEEALATLDEMLLPADTMPQFDSPLAQMASLCQQQKKLAFQAKEQAERNPSAVMDEDWLRKQLELAHLMKQALVKKNGPP